MSIHRFPLEAVDDYRANYSMNQSSLKVIISQGIEAYLEDAATLAENEEWGLEKTHYNIGNATDFYISHGEQEFHRKHFMSTILLTKPGDATLAITKRVFELALLDAGGEVNRLPSLMFKDYKKHIYDVCNLYEYYMNRVKPSWRDDTRYESLIKTGAEKYFGELLEADGKKLLSDYEGQTAVGIAKMFLEHEYTKWVFIDSDAVSLIYQMPLYFIIDGLPCKALPDLIRIDHASKRIVPFDFKTHGGHILEFNLAVKLRRYDLQGSFYTTAITHSLKKISQLINTDVGSYSVANFAFMTGSTKSGNTPLIFILDDGTMSQGEYGDGRRLLGWQAGITRYKLWEQYQFSVEERMKHHKGRIWIDQDFNYTINV